MVAGLAMTHGVALEDCLKTNARPAKLGSWNLPSSICLSCASNLSCPCTAPACISGGIRMRERGPDLYSGRHSACWWHRDCRHEQPRTPQASGRSPSPSCAQTCTAISLIQGTSGAGVQDDRASDKVFDKKNPFSGSYGSLSLHCSSVPILAGSASIHPPLQVQHVHTWI